jgi:hypothetical protein
MIRMNAPRSLRSTPEYLACINVVRVGKAAAEISDRNGKDPDSPDAREH